MTTSEIERKLKNITSSWFMNEPLLFATFCTHSLVPNTNLTTPMRTGQLRIEFSPELLSNCSEIQLEAYLKIEIYRILLQHPYKRQPYKAQNGVLTIASDVSIYNLLPKSERNKIDLPGILYLKNQAVRFGNLIHPLGEKWAGSEELKFFQRNLQLDHKTGELLCVDDLSFEQWYKKIFFLIKETSFASSEAAGFSEESENLLQILKDSSELWEENEEAQNQINKEIKRAECEQGWGGTGGELIRGIKDQCDFSFDYRKVLTQFRQNIVSANRFLTRMRPSRRYGFNAMGSRYLRKANILIAVDVSGSITDESFSHFYHAINNFFFLGIIEKIDLIFFDVNLKNTKPITFKKKIKLEEIKGRGGTNFQPPIDFYFENQNIYNGLIIFTDGEGPVPVIDTKSNILWIFENRLSYEKNKQNFNYLPGCKTTYLPV